MSEVQHETARQRDMRRRHTPVHGKLREAAAELEGLGLEPYALRGNIPDEALNILITEAVNHAAKDAKKRGDHEAKDKFYNFKAAVFVETALLGKKKGVSVYFRDDGHDKTWNIHHKDVGVVSFHDPKGEISRLMKPLIAAKMVDVTEKPYQWSGVARQPFAFETLQSLPLAQHMAKATAPVFEDTLNITELDPAHTEVASRSHAVRERGRGRAA